MRISLIVAMTNNRVIGRNNAMPWHLPADLLHFKRLTTGHAVIMGRKTHESIGRALPNRKNIVITSQQAYKSPERNPSEELVIANSLDEAIEYAKGYDEVFIIGGGKVFAEAMPIAKRIYLTRIDTEIDGDTFFPAMTSDWQQIDKNIKKSDKHNQFDLFFEIYEKY